MNDGGHAQSLDEFEVEVSDLRATGGSSTSRRPRSPLERHLSSRQRAQRLLVVVGTVLLALVLLMGSIPMIRSQVVGWLSSLHPVSTGDASSAVPPAPVSLPGNHVYIFTDVPWTTVLLDGHPIQPPAIGTEAPLVLAHGRHFIAWTATPFFPQHCWISVPREISDTCLVHPEEAFDIALQVRVNLLVLHESLNSLPADQSTALTNAAQSALDGLRASATVQPGEQFLTTGGVIITAGRPLRATLGFRLQTGATTNTMCQIGTASTIPVPCQIAGQNCQSFCTLSPSDRPPSWAIPAPAGWLVWAVVHPSWDYATLDGRAVARDQPIDTGAAATSGHLVALNITWSGSAWRVTVPFAAPGGGAFTPASTSSTISDPACAAALDRFQTMRGATRDTYVRFISGRNPSDGCLIATSKGTLFPLLAPTAAPDPYYLERFGVLLAVTDAAHRQHPELPQANADQRQVAEQLAAQAR